MTATGFLVGYVVGLLSWPASWFLGWWLSRMRPWTWDEGERTIHTNKGA
jgi:hypothetical protein